MKKTEFVIQEYLDGAWVDCDTNDERLITPQKNFLRAESVLARIMATHPGRYRIVSRSTQEYVVVEKDNG